MQKECVREDLSAKSEAILADVADAVRSAGDSFYAADLKHEISQDS